MKKVFAKSSKTNVRALPNRDSEVLDTISKTSGLEYKGVTPSHNGFKWLIVDFKGKTGYVREDVGEVREDKEHPFKDLVVEGSKAPFATASRDNITVTFSDEMLFEYLPVWKTIEAPKGIKMLALVMAQKEGYRKGTRSHRFNNPGNIGNTDSGANKGFKTLEEGIKFQIKFLTDIAEGRNRNFPLGKQVFLKPYYSPEIAKNQKVYQLEPYCPGYRFTYTGQLDQFVKIYSTGARQKNSYLSLIRSYFKRNGVSITDETTLKEILDGKV